MHPSRASFGVCNHTGDDNQDYVASAVTMIFSSGNEVRSPRHAVLFVMAGLVPAIHVSHRNGN
jgi:hypothetical protein